MKIKFLTNTFLVALSIFALAITSCNKDDDSNTIKDASVCLEANEELMSCYNCCASNGFDGGDLDLINLTCECFDDEDENPNPNTSPCSGASSYSECVDCCDTHGSGEFFEWWEGQCNC